VGLNDGRCEMEDGRRMTEEAPSFARLSTCEKKKMSEEIKIVEGKE